MSFKFRGVCDALFWCFGITAITVLIDADIAAYHITRWETMQVVFIVGVMIFFWIMTMIEDSKNKDVISNA